MDFTEAKPSEAQLIKLSKLQEKMTKRYLYHLKHESQISVEKRPVDENEKDTTKKATSQKGKRKKGHPMTENNDPQPSTSSGTTQQNEPKPLLSESLQLPFISNSYYSSDPISPNHKNKVVPKECIKYFSGGTGRPITVYPEPWGTNELEFCEPVKRAFKLTQEQQASGIKATVGQENLPVLVFGGFLPRLVLPNLEKQDFALPWLP